MQKTGVAPGRVISGARRSGSLKEPAELEYNRSIIATWGQRLCQVSQDGRGIS